MTNEIVLILTWLAIWGIIVHWFPLLALQTYEVIVTTWDLYKIKRKMHKRMGL